MEQQFQSAFRRLLLPEQRRSVLEALSSSIPQDATVGDLVDAARALGWSDPLGELTLQDLADALLHEPDEVDDEAGLIEDTTEVEDTVELGPPPSAKPAKKVAKKTAKAKPKSAAPKPMKKSVKPDDARLAALKSKLDAEEPMSLEEAAEVLVPIVAGLETATMQSLEEFTGIGRRKLRFHIGQLVRHEYIERHGMGRGTYYTAC
ncbi:MAG: hypothetical protein AAGA54_34480 [Myxococcota bacterium]